MRRYSETSPAAAHSSAWPDAALAAPALEVTARDVQQGDVARLQAAASEAHGPVLRGNVPPGTDAGPAQCVYLVGPEAMELALATRVGAFSSDEGWRHILGSGLGRAVLNTDDPAHAAERRMWAPTVSNTAIQTHWASVNRTIDRYVDAMADGVEFDAYVTLRAFAYQAVARSLAGLPEEAVEPSFAAIRAVLDGCRPGDSRESFLDRLTAGRASLTRLLQAAIVERRMNPRPDSLSLLDQLLSHPRFANDRETDDQILGHLHIMLIAAHDTGASLFSRTIYTLAERPDIADLLAREVEASGCAATNPLSIADLDRLPWLQRFLLEAGRLYPSLVNLPRVAIEDVTVGGYRISAGTRVALAVGATHLLSTLYPDPLRLDLERYREPHSSRTVDPFGMLVFSGGSRMCMGKRFAQLEFKALVARVVTRLQLSVLDEQPVPHAGFWNARPGRALRVVARGR